jgi:O-antigen/teichoic acid export membrane protein
MTRSSPDSTAQKQVATGSFWSGMSFIVTTIGNLAITVALVRLMSRTQYGGLATAMAAVSLVSVLSGFGLAQSSAQVASAHAAEHPTDGLDIAAATTLRLALLLALGMAVVSAVGLAVASAEGQLHGAVAAPLFVMLPIAVLSPISQACSGLLRATFRPVWLSVASILTTAVQGGLIGLLVVIGHRSATAVGTTRSIAFAVATLCLSGVTWQWWRNRERVKAPLIWRRLIAFSGAMLLTAAFTTAVAQLDVLILGLDRGSSPVGVYQPVSRLVSAIIAIPAIIGSFFLPVVSKLAARNETDKVRSVYHWAARWSLVICAPALSVVLVCPVATSRVLFGGSFPNLSEAARILAAAATIHIALGLNGLTLDAYGLVWQVTRRLLVSLAASAVACAVLIPLFGITGAALATLVGLTTSNVLCSGQLWLKYRIAPWDRAGSLTVLGFGVSAGLAWLADRQVHSNLVQAVIAVGIVSVGTIATSTATSGWEEWKWFLGSFNRTRPS